MIVQNLAKLRSEFFTHKEIGYAQRSSRNFIFIRRPNTAACRTNSARPARLLSRRIKRDVRRQYKWAPRAYPQAFVNRYTAFNECIRFGDQRVQSKDNAVSDKALHTIAQDARRDQVQNRLLAANDKRVPGVVATLKADNGGCTVRQQVDDLSLALVAPLSTDDNYVSTHGSPVCVSFT